MLSRVGLVIVPRLQEVGAEEVVPVLVQLTEVAEVTLRLALVNHMMHLQALLDVRLTCKVGVRKLVADAL